MKLCQFILPLVFLATACSGTMTVVDGTGSDAGPLDAAPDVSRDAPGDGNLVRVPEAHRAQADACDHVRGPGSWPPSVDAGQDTGVPESECYSDSDCTAGINGRCNNEGRMPSGSCTYDKCFNDSECGGTNVCKCSANSGGANVCLASGNCRVDANCGDNYCSPSFGSCGAYLGTVGYYCHTREDECVDDKDCKSSQPGQGAGYCAFEPTVGHWKCSYTACAG